ncbi:probable PHD and RING finger domain-containing protein 1 at N-terminal half [Coccomyxa sp. Obi]|nr:probable PHD and RING finger domain-containing protein 1 at N-terminal half [Coccomyxa sp. Obi]
MVICGICHDDDLLEVGELNSCDHSFCFPCISKWAQIESRCPFCKARFTTLTHKLLGDTPRSEDDDTATGGSGEQGKVLQVLHIPERNQRVEAEGGEYFGSSDDEDPMDEVFCIECGAGDDESHLLLCDGCDNACHTYCANLPGIPEQAWFCAACERRAQQPARRSQRRAGAVQPTPPAAGRTDQGAEQRQESSTAAAAPGSEGRAGRRRRASVAADMGVSSPIDLTLSASPEAPRPRRRRLQRMNGGPVGRRRGPTDAGTVADLLDVLEARERNRCAHELPSSAHRQVEHLRRNWDALRQGQIGFSPAGASHPSPCAAQENGDKDGESALDAEEAAWRPLAETRRLQSPAARAEQLIRESRSQHQGESSGRSTPWGSDIRAEIAAAREVGRLLGPSDRLTNGRRRPSLRSRTGPLHLSSRPSASAAGPSQADRRSPSRGDALQSRQQGGNSSSGGARRPWSARTAQQLPRPSSGCSRGRAGSPPRLGRHSSSRARPPPSSHMPGLQLTRSTAPAIADCTPRQSAHDQPAPIHPSVWTSHKAAHPVPPASGAAGPSAGQQRLWCAASQDGSLHACTPSQAMSPQPVAPLVSPYAAVYGAAAQQRQQPTLGSPSPLGSGAPATPSAMRHSGGQTTGAGAPAADTAAGFIRTCHPSGIAVALEPALDGRKSANGSDESSASMAAVRDPDAHLPPAQKRRRINDPLQSSSTRDGRSHHGRSSLEQGSNPAAGGREQHRSREAHSQPDAVWQDGTNAKQAAFAEVKALLSPLLGRGLVDREQYKAAAKAATHLLYRGEGAGAHGAAQALGEVLSGMDLAHAAVAVLQGA